MRRHGLWLVMALSLGGCASAAPYGYFVGEPMPAHLPERVAADTATQVMSLFPPAKTQLVLRHATNDPYGTHLVEALRVKGYAVSEFCPESVWYSPTPPGSATQETRVPEPTVATGVPLRYILDGSSSDHLYRLTVLIGSQTLSRAYVAHEGGLAPAGAWARKE